MQLRELTRMLASLDDEPMKISDMLGLAENLSRRLTAHSAGLETVYYPAAAPALTPEEWKVLSKAAPT